MVLSRIANIAFSYSKPKHFTSMIEYATRILLFSLNLLINKVAVNLGKLMDVNEKYVFPHLGHLKNYTRTRRSLFEGQFCRNSQTRPKRLF